MFVRIFRVGIEDVFDVGLAIGEVQGLDIWHGRKHANNGFIGVNIGHRVFGVSGMRVNAEFTVDEAFDASLETMFETVFASSGLIIYSAPRKVATGID